MNRLILKGPPSAGSAFFSPRTLWLKTTVLPWYSILLLATAFVTLPALGDEVGGVRLQDKLTLGGQELVLNGAGVRTFVFLKIYVGSLYVPAKARDFASVVSQTPRRVQLNMLRDLSSDRIVSALEEGLTGGNDETTLAAVKGQREEFIAIIRSAGDVKGGEVVTFDFVDGETRIGLDGAMKGSVYGQLFNRALTAVWIGDNIKSDPLKRAMLGN